MDLRQLRQFVTIARTGSFVSASRELCIAQPPLTVSIRRLEEDLGLRLFDRHARGAQLTQAGKALLRPASEIVARSTDLRRLAGEIAQGHRGQLRIGFVGSASYGLLPKLLRDFRAGHPDIDLNVMEMTSQQALQQLDKREIDIGLVRAPVLYRTEARIVHSIAEPMMLMVPADHALAGETSVRLETLHAEQFILYDLAAVPNMRSIVCAACEAAGFTPRVAHEAAQIHGLIALVEGGLGIALLPASVRRVGPGRGRFLDITAAGAIIETRIALAVPGGEFSAIAQSFIELASDHAPGH